MSKLTLSIDEAVISQAKQYAKANHTSISEMVEIFLANVTGSDREKKEAPILRSVRGLLKGVDPGDYRNDYRRHLSQKYR